MYINFVELHSLMLYAKFQNHRPSGSGEDFLTIFTIYMYGHGDHLGHENWSILCKLSFALPNDAPYEVWL